MLGVANDTTRAVWRHVMFFRLFTTIKEVVAWAKTLIVSHNYDLVSHYCEIMTATTDYYSDPSRAGKPWLRDCGQTYICIVKAADCCFSHAQLIAHLSHNNEIVSHLNH